MSLAALQLVRSSWIRDQIHISCIGRQILHPCTTREILIFFFYMGLQLSLNWCFWTVVLEKTLESPLDCKEIQPVHPKGNQSWIFIGKIDVEAETPIFGHLMLSADLLKRLWCWERLRAGGEGDDRGWDGGWHHSLNGHEFEWTPGVGDGQGGLACCSPWGHKESDTTEWLIWT